MVRRGFAQIVTFFAVDSASPPARKSGITFAPGDAKISKDGAAFAATANVPTELGSSGRYQLALTAAELDCIWLHVMIEKTGMQPQDIAGSSSGHPSGSVVTGGGTNNGSLFATSLASAVNGFWVDALLVFTTGALAGQVKRITAYDGATKVVTLSASLTGTPAPGDQFLLINI